MREKKKKRYLRERKKINRKIDQRERGTRKKAVGHREELRERSNALERGTGREVIKDLSERE